MGRPLERLSGYATHTNHVLDHRNVEGYRHQGIELPLVTVGVRPMQETWVNIIEMAKELPIEAWGVATAMITAILRVLYDQEETRPLRIILESVICGSLAMIVNAAITAMHLDGHWSVFAGGLIGYSGSMAVRSLAIKLIKQKIDRG